MKDIGKIILAIIVISVLPIAWEWVRLRRSGHPQENT